MVLYTFDVDTGFVSYSLSASSLLPSAFKVYTVQTIYCIETPVLALKPSSIFAYRLSSGIL